MIFPQLQHRLYLFLIVWSGVEKVKMEILCDDIFISNYNNNRI